MPAPTDISELSTTAAENDPPGSEQVFPGLDNYLRAHSAFIAQVNTFTQAGTGAVARTAQAKMREVISVTDFGATGDGVTSDQDGVAAAVARCYSTGDDLYWPDGTYLTTATVPNLHDVRHRGPGIVKRGSDLFYVEPRESQANTIYIATTGSAAGDGLTSSQPMATFQNAFDALANYGPVLDGVWTVSAAAGTYTISTGSHNHYTPSKNRVVIKGPTAGHPTVPTCIIDGGGNTAGYLHGLYFSGVGVRVESRDLLFQNFTQASGNSRVGLVGDNGADLYTNNVHSFACSWTGIMAKECEQVRCTGGILDGNSTGAYGFISDSSHTSFGYQAGSAANGPIVKNCLSAGVYWSTGSQGHCDYTNFEDNATGFYCAESSRCDTVGNDYKRNNVAKRHAAGGFSASGGTAEEFHNGTADANVTNVQHLAYSGDIGEVTAINSGSWTRVAVDRTSVNLSGATPTVLMTPYTIKAYRLKGVGKACMVKAYGAFTSASAGSAVRIVFGGLTLSLAVPAAATNLTFEIEATLMELSGGYRAIGRLTQGTSQSRMGNATGFVATSDQILTIEATLADAGDSMSLYRTDVYLIG